MAYRALIVSVVAAVLASGCGFHLRGKIPLPEKLEVIAVTTPATHAIDVADVKEEMVSALEAGGAQVVSDPASARAVLDMYEVNFDRKVRTIDTRGKVTGYILRYDIKYRVVDAEGKQLRDTHLALQRDYNFDPEQILQAEEEEDSLREDMVKELTRRIMRQLVTIGALDLDRYDPLAKPEGRTAA